MAWTLDAGPTHLTLDEGTSRHTLDGWGIHSTPSQDPSWVEIADSTDSWTPITPAQAPAFSQTLPTNSPGWG